MFSSARNLILSHTHSHTYTERKRGREKEREHTQLQPCLRMSVLASGLSSVVFLCSLSSSASLLLPLSHALPLLPLSASPDPPLLPLLSFSPPLRGFPSAAHSAHRTSIPTRHRPNLVCLLVSRNVRRLLLHLFLGAGGGVAHFQLKLQQQRQMQMQLLR